jgi:hypothetical protein
MTKRIQWIFTLLTILCGGVYVIAQNPVSVFQWGSTVVDTNSGGKSAGTLRVVLATDQPALTNKLLVTPDSVALPSNQSVNVSQINGVTPLMGNGVTGTGSARVTIASDNSAFTVNAAQSGTWTVQPGNTANTTAWKVDGSAVTQPVSIASMPSTPVTGTVTANMGTVTADPFGANADAASASGSMSAKLRFIASTGIPITGTVTVGSHAVTNAGTFAVQPAANSSVNVNQWNGQSLASPDANSYTLGAGAATATTTAGTSTCYATSAASTNSTNCKASAGNLYEIHVTNTTTTNYFLRVYNLSSAPTCSSSTGFVETVPALGAAANGGVNGRINTPPQAFSTGIGFCLTGGGSSTDNTNAATGVYITLLYK